MPGHTAQAKAAQEAPLSVLPPVQKTPDRASKGPVRDPALTALQAQMAASPRVAQLRAMQSEMLQRQPEEETPVQAKGPEDEDPLQGKDLKEDDLLQGKGLEDEEPLQGKGLDEDEPLQAKGPEEPEEEGPLQAKGPEDEDPLQAVAEEEEPLQGKGLEDEEPLQGRMRDSAPVQTQPGSGGGGLPLQLRAGIEALSGHSMADVRVHRNSSAPAQVGALAYAQGRDIHLGPGQEQHLPHEAWHVVQQAQGRVRPTMQAKGVAINDDKGLEAEADRMGAAAQRLAEARSAPATPGAGARAQQTDAEVLQPFWLRDPPAAEPVWQDDKYRLKSVFVKNRVKVPRMRTVNKRGKQKRKLVSEVETHRSGWFDSSRPVYVASYDEQAPFAEFRAVFDALGADRAALVFKGDDRWRRPSGLQLIGKHEAFFRTADAQVIEKVTKRNTYPTASRLLRDLSAPEMHSYFEGPLAQQRAQVTGREFAAFASNVRRETQVPQAELTPLAPTTGQGAHHVSEHGAQSTRQQTIRRAVEYAYGRGNAGATKGNWASHRLAEAALTWAQAKADLWVQRIDAVNARPGNAAAANALMLTAAPAANPGAGVFGPNAMRTKVRAVISQGDYEHGNISGQQGTATATVTGNFQPPAPKPALPASILGHFTGTMSGAVAGIAGAHPAVPVGSLDFSGNGAVDTTFSNLTTVAAGPPPLLPAHVRGTMDATTVFNSGHVSITAGGNQFFDGTGQFRIPMEGNLNTQNTGWQNAPMLVGGYAVGGNVTARTGRQTVNATANATGRLKSVLLQSGYWLGQGAGVTFNDTQATGYSSGVQGLTNGGKVNGLDVVFANTAPGAHGAFQPRTPRDLVRNTTQTARKLHYTRTAGGGPVALDGPLMQNSLMIPGTRADLLLANPGLAIPASLAGLELSVNNVQKVTASAHPDIAGAGAAPAPGMYTITIGGDLVEFQLVTVTAPPALAATNFRVLLKLANSDRARYVPFTAY